MDKKYKNEKKKCGITIMCQTNFVESAIIEMFKKIYSHLNKGNRSIQLLKSNKSIETKTNLDSN